MMHFLAATKINQQQSAEFYEALGRACAARGNSQGAEISLKHALALDPRRVTAHCALGDLYLVPEGASAGGGQVAALTEGGGQGVLPPSERKVGGGDTSAPAPLASFMRSNAGWTVNVSLPEAATQFGYRVGDKGEFTDAGLLDVLDQRTGQRMPKTYFELPPDQGATKLYVTWRGLRCRREHPGLFTTGDYLPVEATGTRHEHVFSFVRSFGHSLFALVRHEAGAISNCVAGRFECVLNLVDRALFTGLPRRRSHSSCSVRTCSHDDFGYTRIVTEDTGFSPGSVRRYTRSYL